MAEGGRARQTRMSMQRDVEDLERLVQLPTGERSLLARDSQGKNFGHYIVDKSLRRHEEVREVTWQLKAVTFLADHGAAELLAADDDTGNSPAMYAVLFGPLEVFERILSIAFGPSPPRMHEGKKLSELQGALTGDRVMMFALLRRPEYLAAIVRHGGAECLCRRSRACLEGHHPLEHIVSEDKTEHLKAVCEVAGAEAIKKAECVLKTLDKDGKQGSRICSMTDLAIICDAAGVLRAMYELGAVKKLSSSRDTPDIAVIRALENESFRAMEVICEFERDEILQEKWTLKDSKDARMGVAAVCARLGSVSGLKICMDKLGKDCQARNDEWDPFRAAIAYGRTDALRYLYKIRKRRDPPLCMARTSTSLNVALKTHAKPSEWKELEELMRTIHELEGHEFARADHRGSGLSVACKLGIAKAIPVMHELAGNVAFASSRNDNPQPGALAKSHGHDECLEELKKLDWVEESDVIQSREWFRAKIQDLGSVAKAQLFAKDDEGCTFAHYAVNAKLLGGDKKDAGWQIERLKYLVEHGAGELLVAETKTCDTPAAISGLDEAFEWMLDVAYDGSSGLEDDTVAKLRHALTGSNILGKVCLEGRVGCLRALGKHGGALCLGQPIDFRDDTRIPGFIIAELLTPVEYACVVDGREEILEIVHEVGGQNALMGSAKVSIRKGSIETLSLLSLTGLSICCNRHRALRILYQVGAITTPIVNSKESILDFAYKFKGDWECLDVVCEFEGIESTCKSAMTTDTKSESSTTEVVLPLLCLVAEDLRGLKVLYKHFGAAAFISSHQESAVKHLKIHSVRFLYEYVRKGCLIFEDNETALNLAISSSFADESWERLERMVRVIHEFEGDDFCRLGGTPSLSGLSVAVKKNISRLIPLLHELAGDVPHNVQRGKPAKTARRLGRDECLEELKKLDWVVESDVIQSREWFRAKIQDLGSVAKAQLFAKDDEGCTFAHYAVNAKLLGGDKQDAGWQIERLKYLVEHGAGELLVAETKTCDTPAAISGLDEAFEWMLDVAYDGSSGLEDDTVAKLREVLTGADIVLRAVRKGRAKCLLAIGRRGGSSCLEQKLDVSSLLHKPQVGSIFMTPAQYAVELDDPRDGSLAALHAVGGDRALHLDDGSTVVAEAIDHAKLRALRNLYSMGAVVGHVHRKPPRSALQFAAGKSDQAFATVCKCEGKDNVMAERMTVGKRTSTDSTPSAFEKVDIPLATFFALKDMDKKLGILHEQFGSAILEAEPNDKLVASEALAHANMKVLRFLYEILPRKHPLLVEKGELSALNFVLQCKALPWEDKDRVIRVIYEFERENFCRVQPLGGLERACFENLPQAIYLLHELAGDVPFAQSVGGPGINMMDFARKSNYVDVVKALEDLKWADGSPGGAKTEVKRGNGGEEEKDVSKAPAVGEKGNDRKLAAEMLAASAERGDEQEFRTLWAKMRPQLDDYDVIQEYSARARKGQGWCIQVMLEEEERDPALMHGPSLKVGGGVAQDVPTNPVEVCAAHGLVEVFEPINTRWGAESLFRTQSVYKRTPAHWAAQNGHLNVLKEIVRLIDKSRALIFFQEKASDGCTPADDAAARQKHDVVAYLAEIGCGTSTIKDATEKKVERTTVVKKSEMEKRKVREEMQKKLAAKREKKTKEAIQGEDAQEEQDKLGEDRMVQEEKARQIFEELMEEEQRQQERAKAIAAEKEILKKNKEKEVKKQRREEELRKQQAQKEEEERARREKEKQNEKKKKLQEEEQKRKQMEYDAAEQARKKELEMEEQEKLKMEIEASLLSQEPVVERKVAQVMEETSLADAVEAGGPSQTGDLGFEPCVCREVKSPLCVLDVEAAEGLEESAQPPLSERVSDDKPAEEEVEFLSEVLLGGGGKPILDFGRAIQSAGDGKGDSGDGVLRLRPAQRYNTAEYREMWGWKLSDVPPPQHSSADLAPIGKGLHNPAGTNNCFLNVIIQVLWHMETFRQSLIHAVERQDLVTGGTDEAHRTELLLSLIETFENLSRDPADPKSSSQGAWSAGPPMGSFGPNVVDPERCRKALSTIFEVHGRGQVMEMGDAAEALHDIFDTLHACFVKGEGHAHPGVGAGVHSVRKKGGRKRGNRQEKRRKRIDAETAEGQPVEHVDTEEMGMGGERGGGFWSQSVVSDAFGVHVTEKTACISCGFEYPSHKYTRFFQMVPFEAWRDAHESMTGDCEPEDLLKATYHRESRTCQKCSKEEEVEFEVKHVQDGSRPPPQCIALLVQWQSGAVSSEDISTLLSFLPLTFDLSLVNTNVIPGTNYRLRCMICLYGAHFIAVAFNPRVFQWVQFDDSRVTPLGGWDQVVERLRSGRYQPEVCFYEREACAR